MRTDPPGTNEVEVKDFRLLIGQGGILRLILRSLLGGRVISISKEKKFMSGNVCDLLSTQRNILVDSVMTEAK
jgi:hypothetical protein